MMRIARAVRCESGTTSRASTYVSRALEVLFWMWGSQTSQFRASTGRPLHVVAAGAGMGRVCGTMTCALGPRPRGECLSLQPGTPRTWVRLSRPKRQETPLISVIVVWLPRRLIGRYFLSAGPGRRNFSLEGAGRL